MLLRVKSMVLYYPRRTQFPTLHYAALISADLPLLFLLCTPVQLHWLSYDTQTWCQEHFYLMSINWLLPLPGTPFPWPLHHLLWVFIQMWLSLWELPWPFPTWPLPAFLLSMELFLQQSIESHIMSILIFCLPLLECQLFKDRRVVYIC